MRVCILYYQSSIESLALYFCAYRPYGEATAFIAFLKPSHEQPASICFSAV